jgi:Zn finger protein HypA/HybF involved in hydrogenase expression/endogenous inhibitor of DNA gyrase (YacG/DUF329 family)
LVITSLSKEVIMARPKTSPIWKIPANQLSELVARSNSIGEVLGFFGLKNHGNNFVTLKTRLRQEGIEYLSLIERGKSKGIRTKISLSEILVAKSTYSRKHLKERLLEGKILKNECSLCGALPEWNGKPLVLILDHINGINDDHRLENLRLVCPNCNSQLPTFAGRAYNRESRKTRSNCPTCGKKINKNSDACRSCANTARRVPLSRISDEELAARVWEIPVSQLAAEIGISDMAIRKRCRRRGFPVPGVGYWQKRQAQKKVA